MDLNDRYSTLKVKNPRSMEAKNEASQNRNFESSFHRTKTKIAILYRDCFEDVFALAYKILRREDLAFEAVSESIYKLLIMKEESFSRIDSLRGYFFVSVRNNALKILEKQKRTLLLIENIDIDHEIEDSFFEDVFTKPNLQIQVKRIFSILSQTHPQYAEILRLFYFESFSHKEIADIMNISENNSKARLSRARAVFKKLYESISPDDDPENGKDSFYNKTSPKLKKNTNHSDQKDSGSETKSLKNLDLISASITTGTTILNVVKYQIEGIDNNNPFYEEIEEGYRDLLKDYGDKSSVYQVLNKYKECLWSKFFDDLDSVSGERMEDNHTNISNYSYREKNDKDCKIIPLGDVQNSREAEDKIHNVSPTSICAYGRIEAGCHEQIVEKQIVITSIYQMSFPVLLAKASRFFPVSTHKQKDAIQEFFTKKICSKSIDRLKEIEEIGICYVIKMFQNYLIDTHNRIIRQREEVEAYIEKEKAHFIQTDSLEWIPIEERTKIIINKYKKIIADNFRNQQYPEIFELIIQGYSNPEIAAKLNLKAASIGTARHRIQKFMKQKGH